MTSVGDRDRPSWKSHLRRGRLLKAVNIGCQHEPSSRLRRLRQVPNITSGRCLWQGRAAERATVRCLAVKTSSVPEVDCGDGREGCGIRQRKRSKTVCRWEWDPGLFCCSQISTSKAHNHWHHKHDLGHIREPTAMHDSRRRGVRVGTFEQAHAHPS